MKMSSIPLVSTVGFGSMALTCQQNESQSLKTSLNAYSFNQPLSEGVMSLEDLLQFCSNQQFEGVDITAYYFPGYPQVPDDQYLYQIKRKAFRLGLEISGTGVRNDFTFPDRTKRMESIRLVKDWIIAAEKIGVPVIRIFAGNQDVSGYTRSDVLDWMLSAISECVEFGRNHGVMIGIQNHHDFIKTAADVKEIMESINSEWFGLILDTGSYRTRDPYQEISDSIQYAINWQIKEKVFINGEEQDTDLPRLMKIIKKSNYQGYLPIETLGPGNPEQKVISLITQVRSALNET